jgi:hypothetical protein
MADHIANRERLVRFVVEEIHGPAFHGQNLELTGEPIDCSGDIVIDGWDAYRNRVVQATTNDEILKDEPPIKRYGVGILDPGEGDAEIVAAADAELATQGTLKETGGEAEEAGGVLDPRARKDLDKIADRKGLDKNGQDSTEDKEDAAIGLANLARQRSMGVTFVLDVGHGGKLYIKGTGGRYQKKKAVVHTEKGNPARTWWLRTSVQLVDEIDYSELQEAKRLTRTQKEFKAEQFGPLNLELEIIIRVPPPTMNLPKTARLITVCLVNRSAVGSSVNETCLLQSFFEVRCSKPSILPYPEIRYQDPDPEEQSLEMLYRNQKTFATGHGCAADWGEVVNGQVDTVSAEALPTYETPSITPRIFRDSNLTDEIEVAMLDLTHLGNPAAGIKALEEVVSRYEKWIADREKEAGSMPEHSKAATLHISACKTAATRMRQGLKKLGDKTVQRAFELANLAVLLQQVSSIRPLRIPTWDETKKKFDFGSAVTDPDPKNPPKGRGRWRPFQIAFLLMNIASISDGDDPCREQVELIWFPTGGGKTEAYLGLTAFSTFLRRLIDPDDSGTNTLMRYTLRLLTAQQFQRASGLICAMEKLRRDDPKRLGKERFTIGIWVGGETTPNSNKDAIYQKRDLMKGEWGTEYGFVLLRCPWCGCRMGPVRVETSKKKKKAGGEDDRRRQIPRVLGIKEMEDEVVLHCPDPRCRFFDELPVYVVDDQIYERRPALVIGTVDKFANLAWVPRARAIFGLTEDGDRDHSPPGLIIQDELHLITGPLGSMVGLYEGAIERLATDYRPKQPLRPKIIASTATTRSYEKQILGLYARQRAALFPPPGLDAGDSFFAQYARKPDRSLQSGRLYVGIHAPGFTSDLTVSVRVYSALLAGALIFDSNAERDPWWTLLAFYNSLRELGAALTLFHADIPERVWQICRRVGIPKEKQRYLRRVMELTGRLTNSEIPEALERLETKCGDASNLPVDACIASNIIEVGVDIERLSLIAVAGQPKTTAQYIQATGRVGRRWWDQPGLVLTLLSARKPRDRSHYERFRSYHERLYAQVEPSTVTPFTLPALERALHAVITALIRQEFDGSIAEKPWPLPTKELSIVEKILRDRVEAVDSDQLPDFDRRFKRLVSEWEVWHPDAWKKQATDTPPALLRYAGSYYPPVWTTRSWSTPTSMRSVDAECRPEITQLYTEQNVAEAEAKRQQDNPAR